MHRQRLHALEQMFGDGLEPFDVGGGPDVLRVSRDGSIKRVGAAGLPEFFEIRCWVVLGVLDAEGRVAALVPNLRLQIGALGLLVHVEESIALFVGGIDQFSRDSMMREGEKPMSFSASPTSETKRSRSA